MHGAAVKCAYGDDAVTPVAEREHLIEEYLQNACVVLGREKEREGRRERREAC